MDGQATILLVTLRRVGLGLRVDPLLLGSILSAFWKVVCFVAWCQGLKSLVNPPVHWGGIVPYIHNPRVVIRINILPLQNVGLLERQLTVGKDHKKKRVYFGEPEV